MFTISLLNTDILCKPMFQLCNAPLLAHDTSVANTLNPPTEAHARYFGLDVKVHRVSLCTKVYALAIGKPSVPHTMQSLTYLVLSPTSTIKFKWLKDHWTEGEENGACKKYCQYSEFTKSN